MSVSELPVGLMVHRRYKASMALAFIGKKVCSKLMPSLKIRGPCNKIATTEQLGDPVIVTAFSVIPSPTLSYGLRGQ